MAKFTNIAPEGKQPILLDLEAITLVVEEKDGIGLFSRDGKIFQAGSRPENVTAADVLAKLAALNVEMVKFPVRWPDSKTNEDTLRHTIYARPDAFSYYVSSAQVSDKKNQATHCAALARFDGHYRLESTSLTSAEESVLLDAVRRHNPGLIEVGAKEAHSRFYNPGVTLFNPAKVTAIRPDPLQVNVFFSSKDRIDFKLPKIDEDALLNRLQDTNQSLGYDRLLPLFYKEKDAQKTRLIDDFARAIAAKTPQLQEFKNARPAATFMTFDQLSAICPHEDGKAFTAHYNKAAGEQYADYENVYFDRTEDMKAALADFMAFRNETRPTP